MRAGDDSAGDDRHNHAAGFGGRFGLHGYSLNKAVGSVGDAVGIGKGRAAQGEEQGGGEGRFFHSSLNTRPDAMVCACTGLYSA